MKSISGRTHRGRQSPFDLPAAVGGFAVPPKKRKNTEQHSSPSDSTASANLSLRRQVFTERSKNSNLTNNMSSRRSLEDETFSLSTSNGGADIRRSSGAEIAQRQVVILSDDNVNTILTSIKLKELYLLSKKLHQSLKNAKAIPQPDRMVVDTPYSSKAMFMPAFSPRFSAVKTINISQGGSIAGHITLQTKEGNLKAVVNAAGATAFRTALGSITALLTRKSVPELSEPKVVTVFGAGKQAEWAIRLVLLAFDSIEKIHLSNRTVERAKNLLHKFHDAGVGEDVEFKLHHWTPMHSAFNRMVSESDLIFCCTPSTEPLFNPSALFTGTKVPKFVSLIGSYNEKMRELDFAPLKARKDVVFIADTIHGVMNESGEVIAAKMTEKDLVELPDIPLNRGEEEDSSVEAWTWRYRNSTVIYKSVGCGMMDCAVAEGLVLLAKSNGIGATVPF